MRRVIRFSGFAIYNKTKENLKSSDKMSVDATTRMFLLLMTISLWKDFEALQMAACVLDWCRFDLVSVSGTLCL